MCVSYVKRALPPRPSLTLVTCSWVPLRRNELPMRKDFALSLSLLLCALGGAVAVIVTIYGFVAWQCVIFGWRCY